MDARKVRLSGAASGILMMGTSERMRVPIGIVRVVTSPLPFPRICRSVYIRSVAKLDIFVLYPFDPVRAVDVLSKH